MLDPKRLDDFIRRATDALPGDAALLREDLSRNFRTLVQSSLSRMDLVSREEFEAQRGVLLRTREKVAQLEARIAELERSLGSE